MHPSFKIWLNIFLLLFLYTINGLSYVWIDERAEYDDSDNQINDQDTLNKKLERLSEQPDVFQRDFRTVHSAVIPIYATTNNHQQCSCNLNFKPIDLGRDYYPRYIQTGLCQPDSCEKYHQCVEKKYKVKVLRKKNLKDGDDVVSSVSLPKPLRDFWIAETISVGVACECVVDIETKFTDGL